MKYRVIRNDCWGFNNLSRYTWDRNICMFLFNRTTLQVFVTYLTADLYMHPLWFYKHQHDNRVHSKLYVACQRWWFQWRFWFIPSVLGYLREEEEHKPDPWHNPIERNHMRLHLENEVKTPTVIFNNPVYCFLFTTQHYFVFTLLDAGRDAINRAVLWDMKYIWRTLKNLFSLCAVWGNNWSLFLWSYETHEYSALENCIVWALKVGGTYNNHCVLNG